MCETPKSPPGDYKFRDFRAAYPTLSRWCVKHLNPRQGITKLSRRPALHSVGDLLGVKHLNPRQGITNGVGNRLNVERDVQV